LKPPWILAGAEQGNAEGQRRLAHFCAVGIVVPKDQQTAYFWLLLASAQGEKLAIEFRDLIERELLPQQRAAAQAAARDWKPKPIPQR
jgi:TPR repeat protein